MLATYLSNVGAMIKVLRAFVNISTGAATINGTAIDRLGYQSGVVHAQVGAATGTPTSFTADFKVQDSADGSTGWADYKADGTNVVSFTQITASGEAEKDVNFERAKRYLRVVSVVAFVGGTSPTLPVAASVILGGSEKTPV